MIGRLAVSDNGNVHSATHGVKIGVIEAGDNHGIDVPVALDLVNRPGRQLATS